MILNEIKKGLPSATLIQDCEECNGRPLLYSIIRHYSGSNYSIAYFKYDSPISTEKEEFDQLKISPVFCSASDQAGNQEELWRQEKMQDNTIIVIDSLSPLLLNQSVGAVLTSIKKTLQSSTINKLSLIALVHGDVHDKHILTALNHSFSCHLVLRLNGSKTACKGVLKRTSGKIIDSDECYKVSSNFELVDVEEATTASIGKVVLAAAKSATVPASTFKLALNSKEEEARSQVVLPYIRNQDASFSRSGHITYEVEDHDYEDEDPDDDLEI